MEQRFSLDVTAGWESGGISFSFGKTSVSGNLQTWIYNNGGEEIQPISGRVLLYQNGKQIKEQKITSLSNGCDSDSYYYTQVDWRDMEGTLPQFKVKVEITDNFGRTYTEDVG